MAKWLNGASSNVNWQFNEKHRGDPLKKTRKTNTHKAPMPCSCGEEEHWRSSIRNIEQSQSLLQPLVDRSLCVVTDQGGGIGTEKKTAPFQTGVFAFKRSELFREFETNDLAERGSGVSVVIFHCGPAVIEMGEREKSQEKGDVLRNQI